MRQESFVAILFVCVVSINYAEAESKRKDIRYRKLSSFLKPYVRRQSNTNSSQEDIISRCFAVDVAVASNSTQKATQRALHSAGFTETACYANVCSGCIPPNQLQTLVELPEVLFVHPVLTQLSSGSVQTQGDAAMKTDLVRQNLGVDGTGLKIGVLSDTFDCLGQHDPNTDSYADDVASGDLPSNVEVLKDYTYDEFLQMYQIPCTDEGRAMLQLIYDVAPGAALAFYSGFGGKAGMARGINTLAAAGCDIIVDDIAHSDVAFFQDDLTAQAVDSVTSLGVAYFSAAGNFAQQSWEGAFIDSGKRGTDGGILHDFGNGAVYQELNIASQGTLLFQWDEPFASACNSTVCPGSQSDVDIYFTNMENSEQVLWSTNSNVDTDPSELVVLPAGRWVMQSELYSGPQPTFMKWIFWGEFRTTPSGANKSTIFGHANAATAASVGAAFWQDTPAFGVEKATAEAVTALGGTPILFDQQGNRLIAPEQRLQPRFVGPDGGSTTFFGSVVENVYYFFGTSAAAPHVAAGAALVLELHPNLDAQSLYDIIQRTALDMNDEGIDFLTGHGLVDFETAARQGAGIPSQKPTSSPLVGTDAPIPATATSSPSTGTSPTSNTRTPTLAAPTIFPTLHTTGPSFVSTTRRTANPTPITVNPSVTSTTVPTTGTPIKPPAATKGPANAETPLPTLAQSNSPISASATPARLPTPTPTSKPSSTSLMRPTTAPTTTSAPTRTSAPSGPSFMSPVAPSLEPTKWPTFTTLPTGRLPTVVRTTTPTTLQTLQPTVLPSTVEPTVIETTEPSIAATTIGSSFSSSIPTVGPMASTRAPNDAATTAPTVAPSKLPSNKLMTHNPETPRKPTTAPTIFASTSQPTTPSVSSSPAATPTALPTTLANMPTLVPSTVESIDGGRSFAPSSQISNTSISPTNAESDLEPPTASRSGWKCGKKSRAKNSINSNSKKRKKLMKKSEKKKKEKRKMAHKKAGRNKQKGGKRSKAEKRIQMIS